MALVSIGSPGLPFHRQRVFLPLLQGLFQGWRESKKPFISLCVFAPTELGQQRQHTKVTMTLVAHCTSAAAFSTTHEICKVLWSFVMVSWREELKREFLVLVLIILYNYELFDFT